MTLTEMHLLFAELAGNRDSLQSLRAAVAAGSIQVNDWAQTRGMDVLQAAEFSAMAVSTLSVLESIDSWIIGTTVTLLGCRPDYGPPHLQTQMLPALGPGLWIPNEMSLALEKFLKGTASLLQTQQKLALIAERFAQSGESGLALRIQNLAGNLA